MLTNGNEQYYYGIAKYYIYVIFCIKRGVIFINMVFRRERFIMKLFLKSNKVIKILFCTLLVNVLLFSNSVTALAGPTNLNFYMPNGGSWKYNGTTDTNVTQYFSPADWRGLTVVQEVIFFSPAQVKDQLYAAATDAGIDMITSAVKVGIDAAIASGITAAKKIVTQSFSAAVVAKAIPILSAAAWTYTALDIISTMAAGEELLRLTNAAKNNQGLIWVSQRGLGDASRWYIWNGSSQYGTYPSVKLNPNNWQYGNVVVN
jgi:hypothetical protein